MWLCDDRVELRHDYTVLHSDECFMEDKVKRANEDVARGGMEEMGAEANLECPPLLPKRPPSAKRTVLASACRRLFSDSSSGGTAPPTRRPTLLPPRPRVACTLTIRKKNVQLRAVTGNRMWNNRLSSRRLSPTSSEASKAVKDGKEEKEAGEGEEEKKEAMARELQKPGLRERNTNTETDARQRSLQVSRLKMRRVPVECFDGQENGGEEPTNTSPGIRCTQMSLPSFMDVTGFFHS